MPFGAHSVAVIEGGDMALRESSSGELTDPPWRPGLTCPGVARVRLGGLTLCLIARCASAANPVWHPYSERHSGTMGAPLRPDLTRIPSARSGLTVSK